MLTKKFLLISLSAAIVITSLGITGSAVAYSCGTSVAALKLANPGLSQYIYAGQSSVIPGAFWDNSNGYAT